MFHLSPIRSGKSRDPLRSSLVFLGQFLPVAIIILLLVLYVSGMRIS